MGWAFAIESSECISVKNKTIIMGKLLRLGVDQKGPWIDRDRKDVALAHVAEVMALDAAEQRQMVSTAN